jgi:basic membrane protein A
LFMKKTSVIRTISMLLVALLMFIAAACAGAQTETTAAPAATEKVAETAAEQTMTKTEAAVEEGEEAKESAAGKTETAEREAGQDEPELRKIKVALLLPGSVNDEGWNATAYRGLARIEEELGFETSFSENLKTSDYNQTFRGYAGQGFDLIIGHGFQFFDAATAVAPEFPDITFAVTSTDQFQEPNVIGIDSNSLDAGFLSGVTAAKMTQTKKIAAIGGTEIPGIKKYLEGVNKGVQYVDPAIEVMTTYTGSLTDSALMKEVAQQMLADGADIFCPNGNQAAVGVFEMVNEHPDEPIYVNGINNDQRPLAPDKTLVSSVIDFPGLIVEVARKVATEGMPAGHYVFGVKEGMVYQTSFLDVVPQDVQDELAEITQKMKDGEIELVFEGLY